jgi:inorganic pyrophosphatase
MRPTLLCASLLCLLFSIIGCNRPAATPPISDWMALPAFTEQGINVVVEIPAGTNLKLEYDEEQKSFEPVWRDGRERRIDFLPYPANYGFIPSTYMAPAQSGDGDALDVLLLCSSLPTGTVVEALPIAALLLLDEGEIDTKIIAVPLDSSLQVIKARNFVEFSMAYDGARHIIESWFLHYEGLGVNEFRGWRDENFAREEIRRWLQQ